jgi:hypothetical protein
MNDNPKTSRDYLDYVLRKLRESRDAATSPKYRRYLEHLIQMQERGIDLSEREIDDTLNGALRGSEFPGDLVGRLRDED